MRTDERTTRAKRFVTPYEEVARRPRTVSVVMLLTSLAVFAISAALARTPESALRPASPPADASSQIITSAVSLPSAALEGNERRVPVSFNPIPEAAKLVMVGTCLLGIGGLVRRND